MPIHMQIYMHIYLILTFFAFVYGKFVMQIYFILYCQIYQYFPLLLLDSESQ